ncbi:MAG: DUF1127 domain-containing protein [Acetobacteraceae bacterium]|nr:DUF1127 domain-containing protein [Acetobacteraceae bacterium]
MVAITEISNALNGANQLARVSGAATLAGLRARFAEHRAERARRKRLVFELSQYTERELADLGFSRADFPAILSGTYAR